MTDKLNEISEAELKDNITEEMTESSSEVLEESNSVTEIDNEDAELTEENIEMTVAEQSDNQASIIPGINLATFNQMTKKNQQYLLSVEKQLENIDKEGTTFKAVINEIADTLIQGQKTGQTAKHLYGTPTECVEIIKQQHFPTENAVDNTPSEPWKIGLDGALLLGSIYTLMTGLSLLTSKNPTIPGIGLLTLIVNYIVAGFAMLLIAKNLPNPDAPKGEKGYFKYFGMSTLAMISWVAAVSLVTAFAPSVINPILPPMALLVIGAVTILARFYLKKVLNIKGGVF